MTYRMIALDLDGTLKNSQNEITPKTKEALLDCSKQGTVSYTHLRLCCRYRKRDHRCFQPDPLSHAFT